MSDYAATERASHVKTMLLAGAGASVFAIVAVASAMLLPGMAGIGLAILFGAGAVCCGGLVLCGVVVLERHRRACSGEPDLYRDGNAPRSAETLARHGSFRAGHLRRLTARALLGHDFLVGDEVQVKTLPEILATLNDNGCLGGMPFQAEMVKYCGQRAQVFRSVDKILDYGRSRVMRRLRGCVLLSSLRCDGVEHGSCHARCYLMWRTEWLRRPDDAPVSVSTGGSGRVCPSLGVETLADGTSRERFHCQFTHLHAASAPMGARKICKDIRPLVAGNVTLRSWLIALATRLFNRAQHWRGGVGWPSVPPRQAREIPITAVPLTPGDRVRVRSAIEIASTLNDKGKHRGLWFDGDQLKFCGQMHQVLARVERIVDDVHGQMLPMKTPCILLEGVDYAGESLNFSAQHDLFFWREVWLEKTQVHAPSSRPGILGPT